MKNSWKYSKLWQQKRDELKIDANPDMDWSGMHQLLDQHMPVTPQAPANDGGTSGSGASGSSGGGIAGASGLAKLGAIIGLSTAVVAVTVYVASHFVGDKVDKKRPDSLSMANIEQRISADSLDAAKDTTSAAYRALVDTGKIVASEDRIDSNTAEALTASKENTLTDSGADNNGPANNASAKTPVNGDVASKAALSSAEKNNTMSKNGSSKAVAGSGQGGVATNLGRNSTAVVNATYLIGANRSGHSPSGRQGRGNNGISSFSNGSSMVFGGSKKPNEVIENGSSSRQVFPSSNSLSSLRNDANDMAIPDNWYDQTIRSLFTNKFAGPEQTIHAPTSVGSSSSIMNIRSIAEKQKVDKIKNKKERSAATGNIDWGILAGINSAGSFSRKVIDTNKNTSLQVDFYAGIYGTYNLNDKWGIGAQLWINNPQKISGGYTHANGSKVDSGKLIQVTDSRKAYFVTLPIQAVYKLSNNFNVKLGPVLNIPIRQTAGSTSLTPTTINGDTVYFGNTISQLSETKFDQKISFGVSGGLQYQYGRFGIEASYLKNLSGFNVTSGYGNYRMTDPGTLHITVGFRLNRSKD